MPYYTYVTINDLDERVAVATDPQDAIQNLYYTTTNFLRSMGYRGDHKGDQVVAWCNYDGTHGIDCANVPFYLTPWVDRNFVGIVIDLPQFGITFRADTRKEGADA